MTPHDIFLPELKQYLHRIIRRVDGLYAIIVSDRDGVPVIRAATENVPELALRPGFLATFSTGTDQASKLGLSRNKAIVSMYTSYQVVQLSKLPLILSFVASSQANTGVLLGLENELSDLLKDIKAAVDITVSQ
ncbi:PREDICTED: ragulator complex protein LAMTOR3-A-like isoform X2 [Priapulus caudatus]|uniref:Ragulator complex protein LAMTOR3-A-like isoform X2 n=1 Tax=Priapulus caudatus TaxID=37621 RepID=A0ABM1E6M9_PRICU|nr:PREDICTED: ragulator complex protein LAMTOR3-A-like isoform X2 [Priapulus caudatus]